MFGFVAKHRGIWPVSWMCDALGVSRSGFHAWLRDHAATGQSAMKSCRRRSVRAFCGRTGPMARGGSGTIYLKRAIPAGCIASSD